MDIFPFEDSETDRGLAAQECGASGDVWRLRSLAPRQLFLLMARARRRT